LKPPRLYARYALSLFTGRVHGSCWQKASLCNTEQAAFCQYGTRGYACSVGLHTTRVDGPCLTSVDWRPWARPANTAREHGCPKWHGREHG